MLAIQKYHERHGDNSSLFFLSPADGCATGFSQGCCMPSCGTAALHHTQPSLCFACSSVPCYLHRIQITLCTLQEGFLMLPLWDALTVSPGKIGFLFILNTVSNTKQNAKSCLNGTAWGQNYARIWTSMFCQNSLLAVTNPPAKSNMFEAEAH